MHERKSGGVLFYVPYIIFIKKNQTCTIYPYDEKAKEYLKKINKYENDEDFMIYLKTFYKSNKMSLNIYCFNLMEMIIMSFEKNVYNGIKYKILKINKNYKIEYKDKFEFSKIF